MPRLIDADALLRDIGEEPMNWTDTQAEVQEYVDWKRTVATINSAPTIDAVEVVRCKECRFGRIDYWLGETCIVCGLTRRIANLDGYCNEGVKQDADD